MARLNLESLERREVLTASLLTGAMPIPPERPVLVGVFWPDALATPSRGLSRTETVDHDETITFAQNRIAHSWDADLSVRGGFYNAYITVDYLNTFVSDPRNPGGLPAA